jgi:hypothetical protein
VVVAVVGGQAVGEATAGRSGPVQGVATVGAWLLWTAGAVALTLPSVATLTAVRAIVPGAVLAGAATALFGAGTAALALAVPAAVAAVLAGAAETGRAYVQASAYGDESRFLLRPPLGYLTATAVSWAVWAPAVVAAPLAWAARAWVLAVVATVVAVATTVLLPRRWHQLSRRWLVAVPAGLVVHDPVVLADTVMLPRRVIEAVVAGGRGPDAADLTGPTPGLVVAIEVRDVVPMVLAPRPGSPRGRPLQARVLLVAPSRPGSVLAEAARRRLPVR